jgi:hypothetical protein
VGGPAPSAAAHWNYSSDPFAASAGGTGGGFGGRGGAGQRTNQIFHPSDFIDAGQHYGDLEVAIQGGSGGSTAAALSTGDVAVAGGGGGGGGLELSALGTITIAIGGQVLANGGDGHSIGIATTTIQGGGGGGGGGGILIHGNSVHHSGLLSAKGGNGGDGPSEGGGGGGGRVLLVHSTSGSISTPGTINLSGGVPGGDMDDNPSHFPTNGYGVAGSSAVISQAPSVTPIIETFDYFIDWGDGSTPDTGAASIDVPGTNVGDDVEGSFDGSHTYSDDGLFQVVVRLADSSMSGNFLTGVAGVDFVEATFDVTANNVAPTLVISGDSDVDEAASYTLNLSPFDPGDDTITQWEIDWGDGDIEIFMGNPTSVNHTYDDGDDQHEISAQATDEDDTFTAGNTVLVTLDNIDPTANAGGPYSVNEGATVPLSGTGSDVAADVPDLVFEWDLDNDNVFETAGLSTVFDATNVDGNGSSVFTVKFRVTDGDGGETISSTTVTVLNVDPTVNAGGPYSVNEGATVLLTGTGSDVAADVPGLIFEWDLNNDNIFEASGVSTVFDATNLDGNGSSTYTVNFRVSDGDGGVAISSTIVTVLNVHPTGNAGGPYSVNEGSSVTLAATGSDVPGDSLMFAWDLDGDSQYDDAVGATVSFSAAGLDGPASINIGVRITDGDGGQATSSTTVSVQNVAPTANTGGPYFTFDDVAITLSGNGIDAAGALDPLTFAWDLDNNGSFETSGASVVFDPIALGFTGTQTRTVKLRVNDGDGGVTITSTTVDLLGQGTLLIGNTLYVVGSNTANDIALITQSGGTIQVSATFNSSVTVSVSASAVNTIDVRLRNGHDVVVTWSSISVPMTIDGGHGNDALVGGSGDDLLVGGDGTDVLSGNDGQDVLLGGTGRDDLFGGDGDDVIIGGDGNDMLYGGTGRDLMIGSKDEDRLSAGDGDDILIGGWTSYDDYDSSDEAAIDAVMAIWTSGAAFATRVANLQASGLLDTSGVNATVFDDNDQDVIVGGSGRDLVFGDASSLGDGVSDLMSLSSIQDTLVAVN